jgi:TM2 domain-containing membrane protein YozV/Flp pilus assembly protein TadD
MAEYDQDIRLSPNNPVAYYNRGIAYYGMQNYGQALADFNRAIQLFPKYAQAYYSRASVYSFSGNVARLSADYDRANAYCAQALADFDQAIRLKPDFADAYVGRGAMYLNNRDIGRAFADCNWAIRIDPGNAMAYQGRASAYAMRGEYDRAIADFETALRIDPKIPHVRESLEQTLQLLEVMKHNKSPQIAIDAEQEVSKTRNPVEEQRQTRSYTSTFSIIEDEEISVKNKWIIFLLCFFFGWLGVHKFYEGKIGAGILYLCSLGIFGIGVIHDLWYLLMIPNRPITETDQYQIYLRVLNALEKSGYSVNKCEAEWCTVSHFVGVRGRVFVVAVPSPGLLSAIIGALWKKYESFRFEATAYGTMARLLRISQKTSERNGYDFKLCHYWPKGSFVGGVLFDPAEDNKWLDVLKAVINGDELQLMEQYPKEEDSNRQTRQRYAKQAISMVAAKKTRKIKTVVFVSIGIIIGILLIWVVVPIIQIMTNDELMSVIYAARTKSDNPQNPKLDPISITKPELFYIPVKSGNGFYKYVTLKGNDLTKAEYLRAYVFQEGRALVQHKDSLWGYIDTAGKSFDGRYRQALSFKDGMAWVNDKGTIKALDLNGRVVKKFSSDMISIWSFYDGMALFSMNGGQSYIDKNDKVIGGGRYFADGNRFQEGAASVMCNNGKYGYIDINANFIIDCKFDEAKTFKNSMAIVRTGTGWGVINKRGNYVLGPYRDVEMINPDEGMFKFKKDGKWGWLNLSGKVVIQPVYDDIMSFDDRYIAPVKQGGKWGYIDKNGRYVIDRQYDVAYPFFNNRALVRVGNDFVTIDKHGRQDLQTGSRMVDPSYWNFINSGIVGGPRIMTAEPSFRCDASGLSNAEKMICRSVRLARLDKDTDDLYKRILRSNRSAERSQKEFLATRNRCGTSDCIESVYENRQYQLSNF